MLPVLRIDDKARIKKQYPYSDMDTPYGKQITAQRPELTQTRHHL